MVEGDNVNITCRLVSDGTPVVIWLKDDIPVETVRDVVLVIESVNRSQSGNYACFSVSHDENKTSAITAVNVLCEYFFKSILKTDQKIGNATKKILASRVLFLATLWVQFNLKNSSLAFQFHSVCRKRLRNSKHRENIARRSDSTYN